MPVVTQSWTHSLPMMQQTVLLTAVRGPDGIEKYHPCKYLIRWFRRCVLLSAMDYKIFLTPYEMGGGSFTGPSYTCPTEELNSDWRPEMASVVGRYLQSLDALPHHFQLHFMHAVEIVGYKHPDVTIRDWWRNLYFTLVSDMHLMPETEQELDARLCDNETSWRARNHAATQD